MPTRILNDTDGTYDKDFLTYVSSQLGISNLDDWYRVSRTDLEKCNAFKFLQKRGGLLNVLLGVYPNHQWDESKFHQGVQKKNSQWWLYKIIKEVLPPNLELIEDYVHPSKTNLGGSILFDIYIPSLKLVFEYNGTHHYHSNEVFGDTKSHRERDSGKLEVCRSEGITVIEVPYWWRRDKESIVAILHKHGVTGTVSEVPMVDPFSYEQDPGTHSVLKTLDEVQKSSQSCDLKKP